MITIAKNQEINVEVLKSLLERKRNISRRFSFKYTAKQMYSMMLAALSQEVAKRNRKFCVDTNLQQRLEKFSQWLTEDTSKCGMMLCGRCGNGKTSLIKSLQSLMNLFQFRDEENYSYYTLRFLTAQDIVMLYKNDYKAWRELASCNMLAIDDLGCEPTELINFGNVARPIVELFTIRYDNQKFTIISTNLKPTEIRSKYGDRIADRLNEMMEKIYFDNDSYRSDEYKLSA